MTLSATTDDRPRHAERAPHRRGPRASVGERLRAWTSTTWFLLPALLLFFFFVLIPIFVAFYTSFFRWGASAGPRTSSGSATTASSPTTPSSAATCGAAC
ncbi:hypothetical protein LUW74_10020 [Actinomadura madurae]|nr:hypothetical protein [Actinomadura madurae]MCP9963817.1 hypothetical protein [Actinomadura madurae]URN03628.1 hypothetical protein LUW74_10020 [Actinomadura madurae]